MEKQKNFLRRTFNRIMHIIARFSPGCESFRPFLHKLRGVKIYGNVFIGDDVYIENEYPESVEIHDKAAINLRSTIIAHFREGHGKVIIQKKARIGACCTVVSSSAKPLIIGEGAFLAAGSVVTKNVPPFTLVGGVPARPIAKITVPATQEVDWKTFKEGLIPIKKKGKKGK